MSQFKKLIRLFNISPKIAISKVLDTYSKKFKYNKLNEENLTTSSYSQYPFKPEQKLYTFFQLPGVEKLIKNKEVIQKLAENFINHNFNLLGRCWNNVKITNYELRITNEANEESQIPLNPPLVKEESRVSSTMVRIKEVREYPNSIEQKKIRDLIDKEYELLDWQLDFKSGYRWDENTWYKDIKFGNVKGADIKVPWELGRMQHLPVLAYAFLITNYELRITNEKVNSRKSTVGSRKSNGDNVFIKEFQNQILDFISSNPPGFGVQWVSSMDVAIRAVNWLESYSILITNYELLITNERKYKEFEYYFIRSIYEHGKHIVENLEWSSGMRGNHYLANIAGLVFISSHLPETEETNSWLNFAINEMCNEILYQFNEDGSNFEASTNYHYFSAEIVFNTIALILSLPKEKKDILKYRGSSYHNFVTNNYSIQAGLWDINEDNQIILNNILINRLNKIYEFSSAIVTESGTLPQIGDNDSGQLLITNYESEGQKKVKKYLNQLSLMKNVLDKAGTEHYSVPTIRRTIKGFEDFGMYILENKNYKMFIRCGSVGQKGKGGHCHNDQLSYELFIDNKAVIVDPGTYVYTANPELRNEYRSTKMHNTLSIEGYEQNEWDNDSIDDLFWLKKDKAQAKMIEFSETHFIGEHYGFPKPHRREITVGSQHEELTINSPEVKIGKKESVIINVRGIDVCDLNKTKFISFHFSPNVIIKKLEKDKVIINFEEKIIELSCRDRTMFCPLKIEKYFYSPSYGVRVEAEKLVIESQENRIEWQIEIKTE